MSDGKRNDGDEFWFGCVPPAKPPESGTTKGVRPPQNPPETPVKRPPEEK